MLVDVLISGEMYYFSFSTLNLSYETLKQCLKEKDNRIVIFKLLSDGVRRMNPSLSELRIKFERFDFGTSVLFMNHDGKFEHLLNDLTFFKLSSIGNSMRCN